jgi:preprotein translocase subunit SecE
MLLALTVTTIVVAVVVVFSVIAYFLNRLNQS